MGRKKLRVEEEPALLPVAEKTEDSFSRSQEALRLLLEWKDSQDTAQNINDKKLVVKELLDRFPGKGSEEQWSAAVGNARTRLIKEGQIVSLRRRGSSAVTNQPEQDGEPTLADLFLVKEELQASRFAYKDDTLEEILNLIDQVGGVAKLRACLAALQKLQESD